MAVCPLGLPPFGPVSAAHRWIMDPGRVLWILIFLEVQTSENPQTEPDPQNVTAVVGRSCELPCRAPPDKEVKVLVWSRLDPLPSYVFVYRNNKVTNDDQDPSFSNRVTLKDPEFLSGDLSLVLKNVSSEDSGTYTCLFLTEDHTRKVFTVRLTVDSDQEETEEHKDEPITPPGYTERIETVVPVMLSVVALIIVGLIVLGVRFYYQKAKQREQYKRPLMALP